MNLISESKVGRGRALLPILLIIRLRFQLQAETQAAVELLLAQPMNEK